jgi:hypothetical protein
MNKLLTVDRNGEISGLNDATRNQEFSVGTAPSDYAWRHPWNARNQYPRFYLDQEPESRCQAQTQIIRCV